MSGPVKDRTSAVVFDLDGTLVDSLPVVLRAFAHALEPFRPRPTMEIFARLGGPPERVFFDLLEDAGQVPAALERLQAFNRDNDHQIQPFAGAGHLLARLQARGTKLAVWTGRDRGTTDVLLRIHGLTDYFAAVVCGDDLPSHKPNPQGLIEIMDRLKVPADEIVLVGDADVDVLGGAACGIDTVLIQHGREVAAEVIAKAWRVVDAPAAAYEIVRDRVERK